MHKIIVFYKFANIHNPGKFCLEHKEKCRSLSLKGRVYIAGEGINGTLSGKAGDILRYKDCLTSMPDFSATEFKEDTCRTIPFEDLRVKTRPEIVSLKSAHRCDPDKNEVNYLEPREWRKMLESKEPFTLIDVRNDYESRIGHFKNAIRPDVKNFFDFPDWLQRADIEKNKKVLMYCTGGIRCEKFSVHMKKEGYRQVCQLRGGILNYAKQEGGAHFLGKCFVFDGRWAVKVDPKAEPISHCEITGVPCDTYINCANLDCNKLFVCSRKGAVEMEGCCSEECGKANWRRPLDPEDIFTPTRRWYHYFKNKHEDRALKGKFSNEH